MARLLRLWRLVHLEQIRYMLQRCACFARLLLLGSLGPCRRAEDILPCWIYAHAATWRLMWTKKRSMRLQRILRFAGTPRWPKISNKLARKPFAFDLRRKRSS